MQGTVLNASAFRIRPIDTRCEAELELVAGRMRLTLQEVLGEERGEAMYTMEWLRQRVLWHLDPVNCDGQVFVAETAGGWIAGHTIVRIERDDGGTPFGLFSTTYVALEARRQGIASSLLRTGEAWLIAHGMSSAVTYTGSENVRLIELFRKHGYEIADARDEMVKLGRDLRSPHADPTDRL